MNIKNNITNYLFDKEYVLTMYENYIYIFKFTSLLSFNDKVIKVQIDSKHFKIKGSGLIIVKITKEELLIKGSINGIEVETDYEE